MVNDFLEVFKLSCQEGSKQFLDAQFDHITFGLKSKINVEIESNEPQDKDSDKRLKFNIEIFK